MYIEPTVFYICRGAVRRGVRAAVHRGARGASEAPARAKRHGPCPWHGDRQLRVSIGIGINKKGSLAIQPKGAPQGNRQGNIMPLPYRALINTFLLIVIFCY